MLRKNGTSWRPDEYVHYISTIMDLDILEPKRGDEGTKLAQIDLVMSAMKIDLCADGPWLRYPLGVRPTRVSQHPFPLPERCRVGTARILFHGKTVVATRPPFPHLMGIDRGIYHPELNLIMIQGGSRSTVARAARGEGNLVVEVYALDRAFDGLLVEAGHWHDTQTGSHVPLADYRFAVLYELARRKHQLLENMEEADHET